jgi:hypothetical protein
VDSGRVLGTVRSRKGVSSRSARAGAGKLHASRSTASVWAAVCVVLGAAAAVAGCGSSSSSKAETGQSAFVSNANAACKTASTRSQAIKKPTSTASVSTYVAQLDPIAHELLEKLNALSPPAGQQAEYTKMIALWQREIALASERSDALKSGDEARGATLDEEGHNVDQQFDHAATTLGLTVCAANL